MNEKQNMKSFSSWLGFIGIVSIVIGALISVYFIYIIFSVNTDYIAYILGSIPGIVLIMVGLKLLNAKKSADQLLAAPEKEDTSTIMDKLYATLTMYFRLQLVLIVLSFIVYVMLYYMDKLETLLKLIS